MQPATKIQRHGQAPIRFLTRSGDNLAGRLTLLFWVNLYIAVSNGKLT